MFNFERLEVWQKSVAFCDRVYEVSRRFPDDERFGLTSQIRRAVISIPSNLAEGSARPNADFAKFVSYASGSLYEVVTQCSLARRRNFLSEESFRIVYADAEEIARMLSGLRKSLGE